jgi:ribosome biogenesis GTPase
MRLKGTIIKGIGGFYYVRAADGSVHECRACGRFRKEHILPMIGDDVEIENSSVVEIYPRRSYLTRPPVANIDSLIVVAAAAQPDPNLFLLDKMLVTAEYKEIEPIVCINKTDLKSSDDLRLIYETAGYRTLCVCAQTGEGTDKLIPILSNKTTAFAGLSGVGKSTILSDITGIGLETGGVSEKIHRGRHTTRHVELMEVHGGGLVFDTPGFSSLEMEDIKVADLWKCFPEMRGFDGLCRFRGCAHVAEPDCAVREAVERGDIAQSRYESYKQIYDILKQRKDWEKQ